MAYRWTVLASKYVGRCSSCRRPVGVGAPVAWHANVRETLCVPCAKATWSDRSARGELLAAEERFRKSHQTYQVQEPRWTADRTCTVCGQPYSDGHRDPGEPALCLTCYRDVVTCAGCESPIAPGEPWETRAEAYDFGHYVCRHYHPGHRVLTDEREAVVRREEEQRAAARAQPGPRQLPVRTYILERRRGGRGRDRHRWDPALVAGVVEVFRNRAVTVSRVVYDRELAARELRKLLHQVQADPENLRLVRRSV